MADPANPHDKFFRSSMHNMTIAQQFFQHYLPSQLSCGLDFSAMKLQNSTYIDESLQETISDLVFSCPYSSQINRSKKYNSSAKIVLLVEHQSSPDRLMPFRVFHYLFNMLQSQLKQQQKLKKPTKLKLPAVYVLVFYHGKPTPYPFSMELVDCFDDPLKVMSDLLINPVTLIDVNQVQDDEIQRHKLLGIMTGALKHSRDRDISRYLLRLAQSLNSMDLSDDLQLKFARSVLNYLLGVGNSANLSQFIQDGQQLIEPIRGEFMTIAEQLRAMGAEEGLQKGLHKGWNDGQKEGREKEREEIAINLLKEGADPHFVERVTGLELAVIHKLHKCITTKRD